MSDILTNKHARNGSRADSIEKLLKNQIICVLINRQLDTGLTSEQFADYLEVPVSTLHEWMNGDCDFSIRTISEICEKLDFIPTLDIAPLPYWKDAQAAYFKGRESDAVKIRRMVDVGILPPIPENEIKGLQRYD